MKEGKKLLRKNWLWYVWKVTCTYSYLRFIMGSPIYYHTFKELESDKR